MHFWSHPAFALGTHRVSQVSGSRTAGRSDKAAHGGRQCRATAYGIAVRVQQISPASGIRTACPPPSDLHAHAGTHTNTYTHARARTHTNTPTNALGADYRVLPSWGFADSATHKHTHGAHPRHTGASRRPRASKRGRWTGSVPDARRQYESMRRRDVETAHAKTSVTTITPRYEAGHPVQGI